MDEAIQFTRIACSIDACIQSVSSAINYHITATFDAGIHALKLNASVRCRQIVASNGCSIHFCEKKNTLIYRAKLNASIGCRQIVAPPQLLHLMNPNTLTTLVVSFKSASFAQRIHIKVLH